MSSKNNINKLLLKIQDNNKLVAISAYNYKEIKLIDDLVDIILIGDSLANNIYGYDSTIYATMDMMINHGKIARRASKDNFIIIDMPFGSYESSDELAFTNAVKIIKETGCNAVKLEVNNDIYKRIEFLSNMSILPVAHIGLLPQYINKLGAYKICGKNEDEYNMILQNAIKLAKISCPMIFVESVTEKLANHIYEEVKSINENIILIGIGASMKLDGQILVLDDILGLNLDNLPKFVKKYSNLSSIIKDSVTKYRNDIISLKFPGKDNLY